MLFMNRTDWGKIINTSDSIDLINGSVLHNDGVNDIEWGVWVSLGLYAFMGLGLVVIFYPVQMPDLRSRRGGVGEQGNPSGLTGIQPASAVR